MSREGAKRTAHWAGALFALVVLLQRFAVPGTRVSLLLPVVALWTVAGMLRGVVEIDLARLRLWAVGASACALVAGAQTVLVTSPIISVPSWMLLVSATSILALRFRVRSMEAFMGAMRAIVVIGLSLAALSVAFMVVQLAGREYVDVFAALVPDAFELKGFVTTYPISYESAIYRSNAWIGLEASFVSLLLGLSIVAGLLARVRLWQIGVLLLGVLTTASGSGIAIVAVAIAVVLLAGEGARLRWFLGPAAVCLALVLVTPYGQSVFGRVSELGDSRSSASLRATQGYDVLSERWTSDRAAVLLGQGAGASQRLVDDAGVPGLAVPTAAKVFVDYGVLAGAILAALLFVACLGTPSPAVSASLAFSIWTVQTVTMPVLICLGLFATWWTPRLRRHFAGARAVARPDALSERLGRRWARAW